MSKSVHRLYVIFISLIILHIAVSVPACISSLNICDFSAVRPAGTDSVKLISHTVAASADIPAYDHSSSVVLSRYCFRGRRRRPIQRIGNNLFPWITIGIRDPVPDIQVSIHSKVCNIPVIYGIKGFCIQIPLPQRRRGYGNPSFLCLVIILHGNGISLTASAVFKMNLQLYALSSDNLIILRKYCRNTGHKNHAVHSPAFFGLIPCLIHRHNTIGIYGIFQKSAVLIAGFSAAVNHFPVPVKTVFLYRHIVPALFPFQGNGRTCPLCDFRRSRHGRRLVVLGCSHCALRGWCRAYFIRIIGINSINIGFSRQKPRILISELCGCSQPYPVTINGKALYHAFFPFPLETKSCRCDRNLLCRKGRNRLRDNGSRRNINNSVRQSFRSVGNVIAVLFSASYGKPRSQLQGGKMYFLAVSNFNCLFHVCSRRSVFPPENGIMLPSGNKASAASNGIKISRNLQRSVRKIPFMAGSPYKAYVSLYQHIGFIIHDK